MVRFSCFSFLCVNVKIYMMLGVLGLGMSLYGALEYGVRRGGRGAWYDIEKPFPPLPSRPPIPTRRGR